MPTHITPFVNIDVDTSIYASGDALGVVTRIDNVPEKGVIHSVMIIDRDKESANLDAVLFRSNNNVRTTLPVADTSENGVFSPTDAELSNCLGMVLVDTWAAFEDNSFGCVDNVGLPYWAPNGSLYIQCVTRGTPTYTATTDVLIAVGIVY